MRRRNAEGQAMFPIRNFGKHEKGAGRSEALRSPTWIAVIIAGRASLKSTIAASA